MTKQKSAKAPVPPAVVDKSQTLEMVIEPGKSQDRMVSNMLVRGLVLNASATAKFAKPQYDDVSLTDLLASLKESGEGVNRGDFAAMESMLAAQAVTLNAIFGELARRAALNVGNYHATMELYLRLALKAQSQSRATVETLAVMKNPPVFARQANINNGGQQQVNNRTTPPSAQQYAPARYAPASARPGESASQPNELLEDRTHGSPQLDTRATAAAGRASQGLEPVEAVNRPDDA